MPSVWRGCRRNAGQRRNDSDGFLVPIGDDVGACRRGVTDCSPGSDRGSPNRTVDCAVYGSKHVFLPVLVTHPAHAREQVHSPRPAGVCSRSSDRSTAIARAHRIKRAGRNSDILQRPSCFSLLFCLFVPSNHRDTHVGLCDFSRPSPDVQVASR